MSVKKLDEYKWCCVRQLISRHSHLWEPARTLVLLHGCLVSTKRVLPEIRASYSDPGTYFDDDVTEMMLLDGCFILCLLLKHARLAKKETEGRDDDWTQVSGRCFVWHLVTRDLLLLENQIPFCVVKKLFQQLKHEDETEDLLVTGGLRLFQSFSPQMLHRSPISCEDVHHLLHLFYLSVGFPPGNPQDSPRQRQAEELRLAIPQWIPCAKELEEAGVRFRERKNATSFLGIRFHRGVLEIPQLELNDYTESLLRNLIAFEQTYPDTQRNVSTYAVFMNCLIKSKQDMEVLNLQSIFVNHLSSRKTTWDFFSAISTQVHWSADNYLVRQMDAVNKYWDSRRHGWRAALVRNYFGNPWVAMSVLAALLLLLMTVLQTFFTVYPYFKPPN